WLEKLGLQQPKTLEDFYHVLKAFKDKDPDGNGKNDTYGLTLSGLYDIQPFMSAYGVKNKYVIENGKRTIPYSTEKAVPVYEWLNKLYEEGILDPKFATNETADERNLFLSDKVGMFVYWDAWVPMLNNLKKQQDPDSDFFAAGIPGAADASGNIMLNRGDPSLWAIPANAPHPKSAFKFLEWWNTKPGYILGSLGIKGHDYKKKDGKYVLTDEGTAHNMDHGDPHPLGDSWQNPLGPQPGYEHAKELILKYGFVPTTTEDSIEAEKVVEHYALKAILGQMPAKEAVEKMHQALLSKKLIDQ
ncbi:MAG TPA: extracellular solute-binding protein, partial [Bacillales bacterium]|nr:extracellular solute-binding protein [Bacillales bacterium]